MHNIELWLTSVSPIVVYAVVAGLIGLESMGIPLPGETVLMSAALMASAGIVNPVFVALAGICGAVVGDSIGYFIGRKGGRPLLLWMGRKFPKHFGPEKLDVAERIFARSGFWAVFLGRFIILLRILAGPLAGALRMPYRRFLIANVLGGITWAGGVTALMFFLGAAARIWMEDYSWIIMVVALSFGLFVTWLASRHATRKLSEPVKDESAKEPVSTRS